MATHCHARAKGDWNRVNFFVAAMLTISSNPSTTSSLQGLPEIIFAICEFFSPTDGWFAATELQEALHQTAIHGDRGAIDIARTLGGKECYQSRELFRTAQPASGNLCAHIFEHLLAVNARIFCPLFYQLFQTIG